MRENEWRRGTHPLLNYRGKGRYFACTKRNPWGLNMTATFGVKLDEHTQARLKALAKSLDRAPQWVIKAALAEYLEREEQSLRERREDEERWQRYQDSGEAISQEPVLRWLDALAEGRAEPCPK
jgi:predicted transcriptional regulator